MGWLLVTYRLPSGNSSARVAVWREVRRSGALQLQQSVVAFPDDRAFSRAVDRLRTLVVEVGGEALAVRAEPLAAADGTRLLDAWNEARAAEYGEFVSECGKFLTEIDHEFEIEKFTLAELDEEESALDRLQRWHERIVARDLRGRGRAGGGRRARAVPGRPRALLDRGIRAHRAVSLAIGALAFGGGVWLLVESVEGLVKTIRAWATAIGISGMLLSALVLGLDVESTAAGVAATLDDLPGTALGTWIGAAIFLLTAGLGIAGLVAPFAVRTPPALLVAAGAASALAIGLSADGTLSRIDGVLLALAFPPLVAVMLRTRQAPAPAAQGERPDRLVLRIGGGLVGLVVGAELLVFGTGRMVEQLGLSEAVFGLLVVAARSLSRRWCSRRCRPTAASLS